MKRVKSGGGWRAIWYTLRKSREAGGLVRTYRALRSKNACKTCALGMGGQKGGMVNELGRFPEVCKKSIQAMAADMQGAIRDDFFEQFSIDDMKAMSPRELEAAGRITQPLFAGPLDSHYKPIEWGDAIARIAKKMRATTPDECFFYFSGRSSNEAGFLLQLLARLYGTNNVNNCSYYCHQASGVGLSSVTGSGTATITLEDLDHADFILLIGANPSSNHPRFMRTLMDARRRGATIIVVNPLREVGLERFNVPSDVRSLLFGTRIADQYIQPNIGGDMALLAGIAKSVIEHHAFDDRFVHNHADGWVEFAAAMRDLSWEEIVERSGVSHDEIKRAADAYRRAENAIFCWAMGITHHAHGVENVQLLSNLAMTRGMIGRPGTGLLPLRGHSNVQGVGSMGVTPKLKDAIFERLQSEYRMQLPTTAGMDTLECMEKAASGDVKFAINLGGNLYGANPDAQFARRALNNIDQVVYLSTTLNTGHAHGRGRETIILPVLARDEEPQSTTQESMFNYVRLSDGGKARFEGPRSEVSVIASIGEQLFENRTTPIDWTAMREHGRIRAMIAKIVPGYDAIGTIGDTKEEFQIGGRTFHKPQFPTDTGRAKFHTPSLPEHPTLAENELRLMTLRSEGQFNTVVYEEHDIYRGQDRRDVLMMNEDDMERMGLSNDAPVVVRTDCGEMTLRVRPIDIPPGNAAAYYPEANILVPKHADQKSKTPAFKNVIVRIECA